ncbi:hypothetical protein ES703_58057 [subsurface metagenome]
MTMRNLLDKEPPPQQPIPITRVCWDELFDFLQNLFKPKFARPYVNLDRVTTTKREFVKVVEWVVAADFKGELEGVTLNCPVVADYDNTVWKLEIAGNEKFAGKYIGSALTLGFGGCEIHTQQKVTLWGKSTTGVSVKMDGAIYGREILLGK